jgi:hypothetical protein
MKKLQKRSMTIALNILAALGATYTITLPDGTKHSNAPEKPVKHSGRTFRDGRKYGDLAAYYRPLVDGLEPSGFVEIPFNGFNPGNLGGAISAWGCQRWGKGSLLTAATKTGIEVLRVK